jgi:hypothetical protein
VKLRATDWIDVGKHDVDDVKLRLATLVTLRERVVMPTSKNTAHPRLGRLILSLGGGRTSTVDDLGLLGVALAEPDADGDFVVHEAYPGVYRIGPLLLLPSAPYYLDAVRVGDADLAMQDVEISSDVTITVAYKTDGGSVRGKAENCAAGGVVLVPSDPARRRPVFSRSAGCDSSGNYEVDAMRPGEYYALAFAGNGPVVALDDALINQAVKVAIRTGETTSADLRAITKPVY